MFVHAYSYTTLYVLENVMHIRNFRNVSPKNRNEKDISLKYPLEGDNTTEAKYVHFVCTRSSHSHSLTVFLSSLSRRH